MALPKNKTKETKDGALLEAILAAVTELYEEHEDEISNIRDRAQEKKISVTFKNDIDASESKVTVKTQIRFCETYTDERTKEIDPDQGILTLEHKGRGGRKNELSENPTEPAA